MRRFILGTDWWTDCDDVVAARILARAHRNGEIEWLGAVLNGCMPLSVPSFDAFVRAEGLDALPIGLDRYGTDFAGVPGSYQTLLASLGTGRSNEEAEDGVALYRRLLANSEGKVDIVEIGFLQAAAALLESPPDAISPLGGLALVKEKVARFWVMAGRWDIDRGIEHNFANNARSRSAAAAFCRLCPVPVTFLGFEIGEKVITGTGLSDEDLLKRAMVAHGSPKGRFSWDPMTAVLALAGSPEAAGYREVRGYASVDPADGSNTFRVDPDGPHAYVVMDRDPSYYSELIESRIRTIN
ncbi:MAG: hypothetical protein IKS35_07410 [Clostridia bacterium]|nr:hypothetical protein [Clostridia bacterium]